MKFVLLVLVVLLVLWLARSGRGRGRGGDTPPTDGAARGATPAPDGVPVVACAQCGLHLPRDEALPGRGGVFCSEAHRAEYERTRPPQ